jgi:hypothetical protein
VTAKGFAKGYNPSAAEKKAADVWRMELEAKNLPDAEPKEKELKDKKVREAREAWETMQRSLDPGVADDRPWWLVAAKHLRDLPAKK